MFNRKKWVIPRLSAIDLFHLATGHHGETLYVESDIIVTVSFLRPSVRLSVRHMSV